MKDHRSQLIRFPRLIVSTIFSTNKIEVHYLIVLGFKILKRVKMLDFTIRENPTILESSLCRNLSRVIETVSNICTDFYQNTTKMSVAC